MADLEEREHGDQGRIREWLSCAVRAAHDKAWIAEGVVSAHWSPVSPKTGRVDAYEWAAPEGAVDQDQMIEVIDDKLFEPPELAAPLQVLKEPVEADIVVPKPPEAEAKSEAKDEPAPAAKTEVAEGAVAAEPEKEPLAEKAVPEKKREEKVRAEEPRATVVPVEASNRAPTKASEQGGETVKEPSETEQESASSPEEKPDNKDETLVEFPLSQLPDDPGPEPDDEDPKTPKDQSFRFFR